MKVFKKIIVQSALKAPRLQTSALPLEHLLCAAHFAYEAMEQGGSMEATLLMVTP